MGLDKAPASTAIDEVDELLREWLQVEGVTVICGRWSDGGIMEIVPEGRATLSRASYPPPFDGLRDLHLEGQDHHLHLDLAKLGRVTYVLVPSVCFGFRPSFEVRFHAPGTADVASYGLALSLGKPYRGRALSRQAVRGYFERLFDHARRFDSLVGFHAEPPERLTPEIEATWTEIGDVFASAVGGEPPRSAASLEAAVRSHRAGSTHGG